MKKKTFFAIGTLIIIVTGGFFYFTRSTKTVFRWRTSAVERGNLNIVVNATGTINPDTTVNVGTQVSGRISRIYVDYNSHVKKGELLAVLDTTSLYQSVQQSQADVRSARAQVLQAKLAFERIKKLYAKQLESESDYDTDSVAYVVAQNSLHSAETQLQRARINLGYATVTAPIDGVIMSRDVDVGQTVASSFNTPQLFSIATDLHSMRISASIDEADIGQIKLGQNVDFTVDAYPDETFTGKVTQIRLQPVTTSNVVTYTVIIEVQNPDLKLMPGMTANLTVHVKEAKDILKVPNLALVFTPPRTYMQQMMKDHPDSTRARGNRRFAGMNNDTSRGSQPAYLSVNPILQPGSFKTIWVKRGDRLVPTRVKLGITDGTTTVISGNDIKQGEQVVIGSMTTSGNTALRSPFGRR